MDVEETFLCLQEQLEQLKLRRVSIDGDGACQFRSLAHQLHLRG